MSIEGQLTQANVLLDQDALIEVVGLLMSWEINIAPLKYPETIKVLRSALLDAMVEDGFLQAMSDSVANWRDEEQ